MTIPVKVPVPLQQYATVLYEYKIEDKILTRFELCNLLNQIELKLDGVSYILSKNEDYMMMAYDGIAFQTDNEKRRLAHIGGGGVLKGIVQKEHEEKCRKHVLSFFEECYRRFCNEIRKRIQEPQCCLSLDLSVAGYTYIKTETLEAKDPN